MKLSLRVVAGILIIAVVAALTGILGRHLGSWVQLGQAPLGSEPFRPVVVRFDPESTGKPISPLIYGVSAAEPSVIQDLGATLARGGGNPSSRYNWVNGHAWNAGRDWQFRNLNYGQQQQGSAADRGIGEALAAGATPLITVPTLGFVARDDNNENRSIRVPDQGGPPLRPGSSAIEGYDPTLNRTATSLPSYARKPAPLLDPPDASAGAVYEDEWIHHLAHLFGSAPQAVRYYAMDNEPDLWSTTHTDVHPARMGYDDMLANFEEYATMVKERDPQARVLGPDLSGWTAYLYSDLDRGGDNFATHADRKRHADQPFLPWWLQQVARADRSSGRRSLDMLDVHYYPQGRNIYSKAADPDTQALRIRSVRSLYDPSYQDESWIGTNVMLIARLRQWISAAYPGTGIAITEYNWGGEHDASGAVALVEVLGTFGREGVNLASYWTYPPPDSPAGAAFRLYRNFDGQHATFGDRSLPLTTSDPRVASFAARHSDKGEVDVILANESLVDTATVTLALGDGRSYQASQFRVGAGSSRIESQPMDSSSGPVSLPPLTVALIRLTPA
jgi:hypothetical protein